MPARTYIAGLAGNRRQLLLGMAAIGALLLAVVRFVGGGDEEDPYAGLSTPAAPEGPAVPAPAVAPPDGGAATTAPADGHGHESETATLRDPFCPLVVAAGTGVAAGNCSRQAPPDPLAPTSIDQPPVVTGASDLTLVDIFAQGGHLHARARVSTTNFTVHVNDTFGEYKVTSLSGTCGEFIRREERRSLCEGEQWNATPSPPATSP